MNQHVFTDACPPLILVHHLMGKHELCVIYIDSIVHFFPINMSFGLVNVHSEK